MIIYFFTIFILVAFSLVDVNYAISAQKKKLAMFTVYLLIVLQVGLRWEMATDWDSYYRHFNAINDFESTLTLKNGMEYGYSLFVFSIKCVSDNYSFFLLVHAIIYYYLIFNSFERYAPCSFISLVMFYSLSMGMMGSNRQLIAFAICLFSLRYAIAQKPIHFFLSVFVAVSFHFTSFYFVLYYFLRRPIKFYLLISILVITLIIGRTSAPYVLFSFVGNSIGDHAADKAFFYLNTSGIILQELHLNILGLFKRLLFLAVFYYNKERLQKLIPYYTIALNGYIVGIAMYFLFATSFLIMVSKGSFYFTMMEPLLLASQIYLFREKLTKTLVILVFFIFSLFFLFQSIALYPELFNPYKSIL